MAWLWLLTLPYLGIGGWIGVPLARWTYEWDRRTYPGLAAGNIHEGQDEARLVYVTTVLAWPAVILLVALVFVAKRFITWRIWRFWALIVLPQIGEHERQKERERLRRHIQELEQDEGVT